MGTVGFGTGTNTAMGALATNGQLGNGTTGKEINGANECVKCDPSEVSSGKSRQAGPSRPERSQSLRHTGRYQTKVSTGSSLLTAMALRSVPQRDEDTLDMICIGFGPASLAIAIALADAYSNSCRPLPKVLFIEKQEEFAWHSGMQLPSAKMQISFLKDLATPRDPTSPFTFINYLHSKGRLNQFINLGTFLPTRLEYEDYMRWCAQHFEGVVKYDRDVVCVEPGRQDPETQKTRSFHVRWKDAHGIESGLLNSRHVVVAAGGEAHIPDEFKPFMTLPFHRVKHSSQYAKTAKVLENLYRKPMFLRKQREAIEKELATTKLQVEENLLSQKQLSQVESIALEWTKKRYAQQQQEKTMAALEQEVAEVQAQEEKCNLSIRESGLGAGQPRFVVIGSGQSAAEIFSDMWTRFPESDVCMIIKGTALRPSDDSPFVNEIFDPKRVDDIYRQSPEERKQAIAQDKGTNYGVVRLELLEHIYEQMYMQRVQNYEPSHWRCKIISNRRITKVKASEDKSSLLLQLAPTRDVDCDEVEELVCSHVFVATGYTRNVYQELLIGTRALLPEGHEGEFPVGRDYGVQFDGEKVERGSGVWLQGCNESTHGLSDTLLSILAVRGGELVTSIFGEDLARGEGTDCA